MREMPGGWIACAVGGVPNATRGANTRSSELEPAVSVHVEHDEMARKITLCSACEGVGAAAIDLIQESFLINPRAIVSTSINDLADIDDEVYLFLEDYHWITSPEIHEALAFFLRRAPSYCHVVLTTRTDPPLPLASLRAQNQLLEIDAPALRFDLQETRNFLEIERFGSSLRHAVSA